MHPLQAGEGLEVQRGVAHGQVAAFHQGVAELARQVQVLEVALVETPGSQHHHQWRLAAGRRLAGQGVLQGTKEGGQVLHTKVTVQFGKGPRDDLPVLQGEAGTGRCLGAIGNYPPPTVRRAGQVHGIQVQIGAVGRLHALARPQKTVLPEHQLRRQQPFGQQVLRPVKVGQHLVEQAGALRHACGNALPFGRGQQIGQQVQLPGAIGAFRIGINVVGDAVGLDLPADHGLALLQLHGRTAPQLVQHRAPVRSNLAVAVEQLIVGSRVRRVTGKQIRHGGPNESIEAQQDRAPCKRSCWHRSASN